MNKARRLFILDDDYHALRGLQGRVVIEQIGNKGLVQPLVSARNVPRGDEGSAVDLVSLLQHHLRDLLPLTEVTEVTEVMTSDVSLAQGSLVHPRGLGSDLIDQLGVDLAGLRVIEKVADPSG